MKMFHWSKENLSEENAQPPEKYRKRGNRGNGGWTTQRSFDGLVRRLLHAMMTQDTFTVVSKYLDHSMSAVIVVVFDFLLTPFVGALHIIKLSGRS